MLLLLVPTAFLALGQPLLLIAVLPQLGINLMSDFSSTTQPMFQYVAAIVPAPIAATVMSVGRFPGRWRAWVACAARLLAAVVTLVAVPPIPGGQAFLFGRLESSLEQEPMRCARR